MRGSLGSSGSGFGLISSRRKAGDALDPEAEDAAPFHGGVGEFDTGDVAGGDGNWLVACCNVGENELSLQLEYDMPSSDDDGI